MFSRLADDGHSDAIPRSGFGLFFPQGSLLSEEFLEKSFALLLQDATEYGGSMIQPRVVSDLKQRVARSSFRICRAVDDCWNASQHDGPRTHRARFECDVDGAVQ